ncbi:hypothetical protein H6F47_26455, partial [Sphaerospermopsis sp. FACHB-1094]|nr:hypothetical protein [Sphaerospermopsis sp. FACHB-1094]
PQSPVPSHQSPIPSHQSPVPSPQSPVPSHQSPVTSPQSPITCSLKHEKTRLNRADALFVEFSNVIYLSSQVKGQAA